MVTICSPINEGVVKNFKIEGEGGEYNDTTCIFKQGIWSNKKLNGSDCWVTDYSGDPINIKNGVYTNDKANGAIIEYEFPQADWATFITNPEAGIDSTKYTRVYTAGVLTSTSATVAQKIKALMVYRDGHPKGITITEVA